MNKNILIGILVIIIVIGGLWALTQSGTGGIPGYTNPSPTSGDTAQPGSVTNGQPVPPAVTAVRAQAAASLGVDEGKVSILSAVEHDWTDGCLGLGGIAESCLQAITPGYEVTVEANGATHVYRTNIDGTVIREQK